ncbi:hypothetical protein AGLY_003828 [Aphis glycines]|uniref:Uncharacterized protein n=1 Tax=Aphis glycines TaxID=307491 RepID=A0A6G0U0P9_APHGL|nr:hypothetical protein AGLY_003828 [Aphis glycines]
MLKHHYYYIIYHILFLHIKTLVINILKEQLFCICSIILLFANIKLNQFDILVFLITKDKYIACTLLILNTLVFVKNNYIFMYMHYISINYISILFKIYSCLINTIHLYLKYYLLHFNIIQIGLIKCHTHKNHSGANIIFKWHLYTPKIHIKRMKKNENNNNSNLNNQLIIIIVNTKQKCYFRGNSLNNIKNTRTSPNVIIAHSLNTIAFTNLYSNLTPYIMCFTSSTFVFFGIWNAIFGAINLLREYPGPPHGGDINTTSAFNIGQLPKSNCIPLSNFENNMCLIAHNYMIQRVLKGFGELESKI